ncbi:MAG: DUF6159 family protein [Myxococcales bacterium]|jgi:hypothetical protein
MGKLSRTMSLMRASWEVLKQDKELLVFPLLSGILCMLVLASFALPVLGTVDWQAAGEGMAASASQAVGQSDAPLTAERAVRMIWMFLFYVSSYFVIIFFNAGLVACAEIRMEGGDPTVGDGLRAAWHRVGAIAGWALIAGTVGMLLRATEERSSFMGRIVAGLLGMAWSMVSFLVVPILVIENEGPISALKRSTRMLKGTWGEQIIGNFSFGLIFLLLALPGIALLVTGFAAQSVVVIVLAVLYLVVMALAQSALQGIFQAALYLYMRDGKPPQGFDSAELEASVGMRA